MRADGHRFSETMNAETTTHLSLSGTTDGKLATTATMRTPGTPTGGPAGTRSPASGATGTRSAPASRAGSTPAHSTASGHAGVMAGKAGILVKGVAVAGVGVAGLAAAAHTGAAPGIAVALSNVPVWTHAHVVLTLLSQKLGGAGRIALHLGR